MNPIYSIMESPHRWLILAGITFLLALVGAMASVAYAWPHILGQVWFWLGAGLTIALLVRAALDWRDEVEGSER